MTSWRARFCMWVLIYGISMLHGGVTGSLPNTPEAMLVYHGSAALLDWLLLCLAPRLLSGQLCDHIQWLCFASACANFAGWILYMGYASPSYYNAAIWGLGIAQSVRLFIPDRHDTDYLGRDLVPNRHRIHGGQHS
jgi:hypothetical protein